MLLKKNLFEYVFKAWDWRKSVTVIKLMWGQKPKNSKIIHYIGWNLTGKTLNMIKQKVV